MKKEYLFPGKLVVANEPTEITTILGSCVAVALRDPKTQIAGLCHYLLDMPSATDVPSPRYGTFAIPKLIEFLVGLGANRKTLQAKIYGGGNVLGNLSVGKDIGATNIKVAREILENARIPILEENVGGTRGRRIVLFTENFEISHGFMKDVSQEKNAEVPIRSVPNFSAGGAPRIAIIDNSTALCGYFTKLFNKVGFNVVGTGTDAPEGYDIVFRQKPDLLIIGIQAEEEKGARIIHDLRRFGRIPPIVVYSFGGAGTECMRALEYGAVDFVHTPSRFDPNALIVASNILLEKVSAYLQFGRAA